MCRVPRYAGLGLELIEPTTLDLVVDVLGSERGFGFGTPVEMLHSHQHHRHHDRLRRCHRHAAHIVVEHGEAGKTEAVIDNGGGATTKAGTALHEMMAVVNAPSITFGISAAEDILLSLTRPAKLEMSS